MSVSSWVFWGIVLIIQNFAFTFVSRARNSGSIKRHMVASFFSNGVWFVSQVLIFSQLFKIMTGAYGIPAAIGTSLYYTAFTMGGSLLAHYYSLRTEKGKSVVGANKRYAQIPVEEWDKVKRLALTIDLGDGGTFNQDELAVLKQVANEWTAPDQLLALPPLQIHQHIEVDEMETSRMIKTLQENIKRQTGQPGPVKVSNATVTVPPIPRGGQGAKI